MKLDNLSMIGKPKEHGDPKDRYFIGPVQPRDKVVLIEDVTTTGQSVIDCVKTLLKVNVTILGVVAVANRLERRDDGATVEEYLKSNFSVNYYSLTDAITLMPLAVQKLNPSIEVRNRVEKYFSEYGAVELKLAT